MPSRRQLLAGGMILALVGRGAAPALAAGSGDGAVFEITHTDDEWRALLTPEQYYILREHGTEYPGTSPLLNDHGTGFYDCAGCGQELFSSDTKYDSGTGWPSFWAPIEGRIGTTEDRSLGMVRTECHCSRCGGHQGHVFPDGPRPTGLRYCINGLALVFRAAQG